VPLGTASRNILLDTVSDGVKLSRKRGGGLRRRTRRLATPFLDLITEMGETVLKHQNSSKSYVDI
jgi:hypothetical protein